MRKIQTSILLSEEANKIIGEFAQANRYSKSAFIELASLEYIQKSQEGNQLE